ncbi:MAG: tRNA lysidine(34) synthetase TilS [Blastocatellia bacterium]
MRRIGIGAQDSVIVAVSGGADSIALLDALARFQESKGLPSSIAVAHLNHQLRGEESDEDETFVRNLARRLKLPVFIEKIAVAERSKVEKQNLEATARRLRYEFLRKVAEKRGANVIFTGHTLDDQAETILMRLIRGSGAEGLRGVHQIVELNEGVKLIRPMLEITRAEVIEHCEHYELAFRSDSSNFSDDFTRNRIRLELLPMMETFNPRVKEALARTSGLLTRDADYLRIAADECLDKSREESRLNVGALQKTHAAIRRRVLRLWLRNECGHLRRIDAAHIAAIESLISGYSGRRVELPEGRIVAREFDCLKLVQKTGATRRSPGLFGSVELSEDEPQIFGDFTFTLKRGKERESLELDNDEKREQFMVLLRECEELGGLRLRTRFPGDAYIPVNTLRAVKLKTLMIRRKIPMTQRDGYPVLVTADDRIVWAPGLPVARGFAPGAEDEHCALIVAEKPVNV